MRRTPHFMLKVLACAALLTGLGVHAATTTVQVTLTPPAPPALPSPAAPEATIAPKQDFATHLALADLSKQGITNPTRAELNAAVRSIQTQRNSGMGWGEIAHSLGLKLGPVVSAANRAKHAADPKRTEIADSRKSMSKSDSPKGNETRGEKGSNGNGNGNGNGSSGGGNGNSNGGGNGNGGGKK